MTEAELEKELDRAKAKMFIGGYGAFYGALICSSNIYFDRSVPTACTDYLDIKINPDMFMSFDSAFRVFVLAHETRHIALLHNLRCGTRDPEIWNDACDYYINAELLKEGYSWGSFPVKYDPQFNGLSEEQIYEVLVTRPKDESPNILNGDLDSTDGSNTDVQSVVNAVIKATQIVAMGAGKVPGEIQQRLSKFTSSIIRWEQALENLLTDFLQNKRSWYRPRRRYQDIYLPSTQKDIGRLTKINFYFDVSGSVNDEQEHRACSEVNHIKKKFNPKELNIIQFDTIIQDERRITEYDKFEDIKIVGRGGTSLECVREHILETKPTAAIIFSDLECAPMRPINYQLEIIWLVYGNEYKPNFGKTILIPS